MTVRAKFKVHSIEATIGSRYDTEQEKHVPAEVRTIKMQPVYQGASGEENTRFWAATPSGTLELAGIHLEAAEQFQVSGEYYLDFTPAGDSP